MADRDKEELDHHLRPVKKGREPMSQWQRFALLIFAIGAIVAVVIVYMVIEGDLARML